jgi:hypothetical protein
MAPKCSFSAQDETFFKVTSEDGNPKQEYKRILVFALECGEKKC